MDSLQHHGVSFVTLYARIVNELASEPRISQEKLARNLDVTMRTVQRHLAELERAGYVRIRRDGRPYAYDVAWERKLPYFEQLTVGVFRPEVLDDLPRRNSRSA
jgi:DNA-binding transcriptional ArsR family regulator